jgi:hypothetical protein
MEVARKALWLIEGRFGGEASLDELSRPAATSRRRFALGATIRA